LEHDGFVVRVTKVCIPTAVTRRTSRSPQIRKLVCQEVGREALERLPLGRREVLQSEFEAFPMHDATLSLDGHHVCAQIVAVILEQGR
jgi:hypothetical protein